MNSTVQVLRAIPELQTALNTFVLLPTPQRASLTPPVPASKTRMPRANKTLRSRPLSAIFTAI